MDERRSDIGQDVKDIVQTRNAISQKLEMLEHRFHETVEETKTSVEDMVDRVKDAADDIVVRTKQTFDPTYHVDQRPSRRYPVRAGDAGHAAEPRRSRRDHARARWQRAHDQRDYRKPGVTEPPLDAARTELGLVRRDRR